MDRYRDLQNKNARRNLLSKAEDLMVSSDYPRLGENKYLYI